MDFDEVGMNLSGGNSSLRNNKKESALDRLKEKYTLLDELGHGAYGVVTKVKHKVNRIFHAVKHIDKRKAGSKGLKEVFSEVETLSLLNHQSIVHLDEVFEDTDNLYIVMEYVPGGELNKALKEAGSFPEAVVRRVALNLCLAVEYIHSKGIVHRDLKPANCLFVEEGDCALKIIDFGFAVMVGKDSCLTSFCGTTAFMAPEIVMDLNYGKCVDIWAVGVILYLCMCGEYPFWASSVNDLTQLICTCSYSFSHPAFNDFSQGAKDLVSKMLVLDANKRITARQALKHHWLRSVMTEEDTEYYGIETTDRKKPMRLRFRGAVFALLGAHRLVYYQKCNHLRRTGIDHPLLRSFSYLVSKHYEPANMTLSAPGMFVGNERAINQLTGMMDASETLETFDVSGNGINSLDVIQHIVKVATAHPSLTTLNIDNNPIPPLTGRALIRLSRSGVKIRNIHVSSAALGEEIVQQIAQNLKDVEKKRSEAPTTVKATTPAHNHHHHLRSPAGRSVLSGLPKLVPPRSGTGTSLPALPGLSLHSRGASRK